MATAPALMTIEQYLQTSYSPDVDFVGGELQERNLGEFDHGFLQGLVFSWFRERRNELRALPVTEMRIRVSNDAVRICDVAIISTAQPREQVATRPPLVCVEIMSPEDRLSRVIRVLENYRNLGVPNIWLIDPYERLAYIFEANGLHQQEDLRLTVTGTETTLNLNDLFAELDEENKENA